MKQELTIDDVNSLSLYAATKLEKWCQAKQYIPTLSIGQMIEFLGSDWHDYVIKEVQDYGDALIPYPAEELCDVLWEAVKDILEKGNNEQRSR